MNTAPVAETIDILPRVPSALIRIALKDLASMEDDPEYVVEMGNWHNLREDGRCSACLAGAVMRGTLKAPREADCEPCSFAGNDLQLLALNGLRIGCVATACGFLGVSVSIKHWSIPKYEHGPVAFKIAMSELADALEAEGL